MGATEDRYHAEIGRMWLVSAVARVMLPGCKADYLLVLEGKQGKRKSSALRALFGEWTLEGLPDLRDQPRAGAQIQGKWGVEIPELHAIKGQSVTLVKQWITTQVDSFRAAYAEFQKDYPRQCVFAATTNEDRYLVDATGGRRFWPVRCGEIDLARLRADRDQLWAEAFQIFEGGRAVRWSADQHGAWSWWPAYEDSGLQTQLAAAQDARFDDDEWATRLEEWLRGRDSTTTAELLGVALNIEPGRWGRSEQTRVGAIVRRMGWPARDQIRNGVRERRYYRPAPEPVP
jgi:putative DNA primase/helicase